LYKKNTSVKVSTVVRKLRDIREFSFSSQYSR
jgi:hypothetical protein